MRPGYYDSLRVFEIVARHRSLTAAAAALNLTKGAVSYQIRRLEGELGFKVFVRQHRGVVLTERGDRLWQATRQAFGDLERQIANLKDAATGRITIGMSTYFASRWLSPRLMTFTASHPRIGLRLQPVIDLGDFSAQGIDMAVRWGSGHWSDMEIELLFRCPAFPTAGQEIARCVGEAGLAETLSAVPLLHDRDGSDAWRDWHRAAGLAYRPAADDLVVPDPNVRVRAVVDGQGVALNDRLVSAELESGELVRISPIELAGYGYFLAYPSRAREVPELMAFRDWILAATAD